MKIKFLLPVLFLVFTSCVQKTVPVAVVEEEVPVVEEVKKEETKEVPKDPVFVSDIELKTKNMLVQELKNSNKIVLSNSNAGSFSPIFNYDDAAIRYLIELINKSSADSYSIVGHTNSYGSADSNLILSQKRADQVSLQLQENFGLDVNKIKAIGLGEEEPLYKNNSSMGRKNNSRVEIRMTEN